MIARKSALIVASQLLNGLLAYVGLKFISTYMDAWEYGIIGFAYGFVYLFSIIGNLGYNKAHIKKISEGKDLGTCIGTYITIKVVLAGALGAVVITSIAIWRYVFQRGFESALHEQAIIVMLAYFVILTITHSMISTFNAKKETAKAQLPLLAYNTARLFATIYVVTNGYGAIELASTYLFGEIFHIIFAILLFRKSPIKKPSYEYLKDYTRFAIPVAIAVESAIIISNIDKVLIQLFWSAQEVGEYFAVYNLSRFVILFSGAMGALLLPTVSAHHAKSNIEKINTLVVKSERYLSMIVLPMIVILVALAEPIIPILLSGKYLAALPVLQILPFFVLFVILSSPYQIQLQGMNMPQITRNRVLIMVVVNVILNVILIPTDIRSLGVKLMGLGGLGAAIATVISYIVGLVYIRYKAWKITGVKGSFSIFFHGFSAGITGIIVYYISQIIFIERWFQLIAISLLGFAIYYAILFLIKEFKKEDFDLFIDTFNVRKMLVYIKDELTGKQQN